MNAETKNRIEKIFRCLLSQDKKLSCAESCTGGLLASSLTDVPGASAVFRGGIVAYSAEIKVSRLGVPADTICKYGVVSCECAEAMARGCANAFNADFALATTGVAGPGAQDGIPAGTVCIALYGNGIVRSHRFSFAAESREHVKALAVDAAIGMLSDTVHNNL